MKLHFVFLVVFLFAVGFYLPVHALVIVGGEAGHTVKPVDDPGWDNVGSVRGHYKDAQGWHDSPSRAGVVYLCDDWFITTYHAWYLDSPTGVVVGATCYTVDTNSMIRMTNSAAGMNTNADVAMFRVTQTPTNLSPMNITTMTPGGIQVPVNSGGNKTIIMIGSGYPRMDTPAYWNVVGTNWVTASATNATYSGYNFWTRNNTVTNILRWGSNQIDVVNSKLTMPSPFGDVFAMIATFNTNAGPDECQIAPIDSGGGVFYKNNGYWELTGLMSTMTQPDQTDPKTVWGIANGGYSYMADISYYRDQIMRTLKPAGWPDLVVTDTATTTTNKASFGATVSIPVITCNQGTVVATNFNTALYLVPTANPAANTKVAQIVCDRLDAGQSVTNTYTFTATATPGVYYLIARADDGDTVHESYENNNQGGWGAHMLEVGPDLTIENLPPVINRVNPGALISIPIATLNRGVATSNSFSTVLYLVSSTNLTAYTNLTQVSFNGLNAGQSVTNTYTFTAPVTPGVYYLVVVADAYGQIPECYENNNQSGLTSRILAVGSWPDITTSSVTNTIRVTANLSGTVDFITRNNGNADAASFATVLFLSQTNTIASMTNAVATNAVSGLSAGQTVTNTYTFKAPSAPGTYYLCVMADQANGVPEINETNNWSEMVILKVAPMAMPWLNLLLE